MAAIAPIVDAAFMDEAKIYESYSKHETSLRVFDDAAALLAFIQAERDSGQAHLSVVAHYPKANGRVGVRRIQLKPEKVNGATWRETIEGWGLIQLQLRFGTDGLVEFGVSVNSEKRARVWAETISNVGSPAQWDWKVVEKHARRLIRLLRKASIK